MKVRDLLEIENVCVDVCDDYDERCYIAYTDGYELTPDGVKKFARALDIPISGISGIVSLHCETAKDAQACKDLFESLAGFCAADDFDVWFKER